MSGRMPEKLDKSTQTDSQQQTSESGREEESGDSSDDKRNFFEELGWFTLTTVGISAAVLGGITVGVPALGFGAAGIKAGSLAAKYQSDFLGGKISPGSVFSKLQSVGAAGLKASTKAGIIVAGAATAGAHSASNYFKKGKQDENKNKSKENEENEYDESQTDITTGSTERSVSTQTGFDT